MKLINFAYVQNKPMIDFPIIDYDDTENLSKINGEVFVRMGTITSKTLTKTDTKRESDDESRFIAQTNYSVHLTKTNTKRESDDASASTHLAASLLKTLTSTKGESSDETADYHK